MSETSTTTIRSYNANILGLGSAFGRDTDYIDSLGYHIEISDDSDTAAGSKAKWIHVIAKKRGPNRLAS